MFACGVPRAGPRGCGPAPNDISFPHSYLWLARPGDSVSPSQLATGTHSAPYLRMCMLSVSGPSYGCMSFPSLLAALVCFFLSLWAWLRFAVRFPPRIAVCHLLCPRFSFRASAPLPQPRVSGLAAERLQNELTGEPMRLGVWTRTSTILDLDLRMGPTPRRVRAVPVAATPPHRHRMQAPDGTSGGWWAITAQ